MNYDAIIFDTETTRIDNPEIIEAAWQPLVSLDPFAWEPCVEMRYRPQGAISLGALATHHIMDEELLTCPPSDSFALPLGTLYLIGHNVDFDWRAAGCPDVRRICTLALCRDLWPEADSHSLGAMMYLLFRDTARRRLKEAHSAAADVVMCRDILFRILERMPCDTLEALWMASEAARVPKTMPFGKHKGLPIGEIPADYRRWLLGQSDVDPYLRAALTA